MKPIRVGLLGLGVVGGGVWTVLAQNGGEIARRAGRRIEVAAVAVRDVAKARALVGPDVTVTTDGMALARDPDIDIIVELMGGASFPAVGELPYLLTLAGHSFYWLRLPKPAGENDPDARQARQEMQP